MEPEPRNFSILTRNIAANGFANVTAVRKIVSDTSGPLRLFINPSNRGNQSIHRSAPHRDEIAVDSIRLDDYFPDQEPRISVVKMDVEGAEPQVLRGMTRIIRDAPTLRLFAEYAPCHLAAAGVLPEDFLRSLAELGFSVHLVDPTRGGIRALDLHALRREYTPENRRIVMLYCTKGSK